MRIAYVSADHGIPVGGDKGAAIHVQEMVRAFAGLGHEVELFAARLGAAPQAIRATARKVRLAPPVLQEPPAPEGDERARRLVKERRYLAVAEAIGEELVAAHRAQPFDLIYERYALWSAAGVRAARRLGLPCLVEVNAPLLEEQRRYRRLAREAEAAAIEREVFAGADRLVAVSREVERYARARGAAGRTLVVPNGVDLARFRPDVAPLAIPGLDGRKVIGFTGGLRPWHGLEVLAEAFVALARERDDVHLLVVGDGPLRPWLQDHAAAAGLASRVTVTGWLAHEALPAALRRMDVATAPYPALAGFYFSPLKLYEYLAAGLPVVASDLGQIREVIEDGVSGLLARPGDAGDLAHRLGRLLDAPREREALGRGERRRAAAYTWAGNARRILDHLPGPRRLAREAAR